MSKKNLATGALAFGFAAGVFAALPANAGPLTLGTFNFDTNRFGNTLAQSDGGAFAAGNWLNIVNADPGSPAYLTGASVNTGIANIGFQGPVDYTIGYSNAIVNGSGADLGVITARFSTNDTITLKVSTDGVNFSAPVNYGPGLGVSTGVGETYFYGGGGPFSATLFVTSVDLADFGLAAGSKVVAINVTGNPQLDLIRVAGLAVPEPASILLLGAGLAGLGLIRRRKAA